jgi:hypothetical protein
MSRSDPKAGANVPRETMDVIEAAVFAHRTSMQGLLLPVINRFAQELRHDPAVQAALRARERADAQEVGTVESLGERGR